MSGNIQIPIFNGENFDYWMIKMKTLFNTHDLWSYIETGYTIPSITGVLNEVQQLELKTNIQKDSKALGILHGAVSAEIFPRISNEVTTKAAWDVLSLEYRG
jgi:hypothetical protein